MRLKNWPEHQKLLALAIPMIVANVTTPLLGLVDTAVLGHLPTVNALAGASIGALLITQIYWVCGFLRMSLTGLSAQNLGRLGTSENGLEDYYKPLAQGVVLALVLAILIFALQQPILVLGAYFSEANDLTLNSLQDYFSIRVMGAPAALLNLVLIGWLVGQQKTSTVMLIQILGNLLNVILNLLFVLGLGWQVKGVAAATVIAEYFMVAWALFIICKDQRFFSWRKTWFAMAELSSVFSLNTAMFIRNLMLQLCLAFITFKGAQLGANTAATNAILMQFFVLISLGLDGVAYAVEALVGEAKGKRDSLKIWLNTKRGLIWSSIFAFAYSLVFWLAGDWIISLLTNKPELATSASSYLGLMIVLPLVAHWCFLYDGVFIGLTRAEAMRNTMLFSGSLVFFPVWWWLEDQGNTGLWLAFIAFLGARGVSLAWVFYLDLRKDRLLH